MFNDLPDNKAIKMGEVFIVKLTTIYGFNNFEVSGVRVKGGLHTLPNLDNIYSVKAASKQLSHYMLGEEVISVAERNAKSPHIYYDDDYEEYQFDSLEHEYEIKKEWERIKDAIPIYDETPEELIPVEIEVAGSMVDTGSEFISTPYQYGKTFFDAHTQGIFSINLGSVAMDEVNTIKCEYPSVKIDNSNHSHLTYLQVDGGYVFGSSVHDNYITGKNCVRVVTTLKEAQESEKAVRQKVRSRLMMKIKPISADAVLVSDLYTFLKSVKISLSELEVKQKGQLTKRVLTNRVADKMKELEQFVMDS